MNYKNIITFSILLIALSVGYYFLVFLPKKEDARQIEIEQTKARTIEQASGLESCLNKAQAAKENSLSQLLKFAKEENKDGKFNLNGAFKDIDEQYEQERKNCFEKYGK